VEKGYKTRALRKFVSAYKANLLKGDGALPTGGFRAEKGRKKVLGEIAEQAKYRGFVKARATVPLDGNKYPTPATTEECAVFISDALSKQLATPAKKSCVDKRTVARVNIELGLNPNNRKFQARLSAHIKAHAQLHNIVSHFALMCRMYAACSHPALCFSDDAVSTTFRDSTPSEGVVPKEVLDGAKARGDDYRTEHKAGGGPKKDTESTAKFYVNYSLLGVVASVTMVIGDKTLPPGCTIELMDIELGPNRVKSQILVRQATHPDEKFYPLYFDKCKNPGMLAERERLAKNLGVDPLTLRIAASQDGEREIGARLIPTHAPAPSRLSN
jgi:hypothetical protein